MNSYGHTGLTLLLGLPLLLLLPLPYSVTLIGTMLLTTHAPNNDAFFSFLSRRGITHTVWFAIGIGALIFFTVSPILLIVEESLLQLGGFIPQAFDPVHLSVVLGIGGMLGILSHVLGDILITSKGQEVVKPFWPVSKIPWCIGSTNKRNSPVNDMVLHFALVATILTFSFVVWIRY